MLQRVLVEPAWMASMTTDDLRGLTPLIYTHVNPYLDISGTWSHWMGGPGGTGSVVSPRSASNSHNRRLMAVWGSTSRGHPRATASSMSCCSQTSRARSRGAYSLVVKNLEHRR